MADQQSCWGLSFVIFITCVCVYQVVFVQGNDLFLTTDNQFNVKEIYRIERDSYSHDELSKTFYYLEKRSAEGNSSIKKATQNEKKPIFKNPLNSTAYPKKLVNHLKSVSNNVSLLLNTSESNTTITTIAPTVKLGKEMYETNFSSTSTSVLLTSSSPTTVVTTTTNALVRTSVFEDSTVPPNLNKSVDYHVYYNSTFYMEEDKAMEFWVDFEKLPKDKVVKHFMLSDSYRRAATVTLSFDFPFYGHPLRNITIATGGFLYMGDHMHSWLAATQYVAPLMANFDTSLSNESTVQYFDNGTTFVIEWDEVVLQDGKQGGNFTFQAILLKNGNIIFVYRTIPVSVSEIGDDSHPVKVGLSDAYVVDRVMFFVRKKTIYEYHRIDMKSERIRNNMAIYFTALPTCLNFKNCSSCMNANIGLECVWCEMAKRCSDGLDRQRQDWMQLLCDVQTGVKCDSFPTTDSKPVVQPYTEMPSNTYTIHSPSEPHDSHSMPFGPRHHFKPNIHEDVEVISQRTKVSGEQGPVSVGGVVASLLVLGILGGAVAWIGYAYRNPHTSSGQLLIRYRPTKWRFRSGEARYTAASVHM